MQISGAEIIVKTLIDEGVDVVFGFPGGAVLNIYDELYKYSDKIDHIITAHEQGASHAADAYARESGKVGVVIATSGPGATNLITGIANAYLDSVPMVAITGNVALNLLGRDSFQEVDTTGITMPITKHNYIVKRAEDLSEIIQEAFLIAKSGRPGPVLIDIPKDVQINKCDYVKAKVVLEVNEKVAADEDIDELVKLISESKRPYIYCGGGVNISNAGELVLNLAEKIDSPIGCSMMGLSALPREYEYNLGMTGMHGKYASIMANSASDLLIGVGVRFSDRATGNKVKYSQDKKIIHIDIDAAELDKNISAYKGINCDIAKTLTALINKLPKIDNQAWLEEVNSYKQEEELMYPAKDTMHPKNVIEFVRSFCDDDTIVATDVGQHQMWTAQYYKFNKARRFMTSGGLGAMGFGMGAAIGACISGKKERTVLFTGDGSFGMNLNELATAVSQEIPLVIIVMNNGVLGMVRQWQKAFYEERYSQTTLSRKTDFVNLAKAFGADAYRAKTMIDLECALKEAFAKQTVTLIDCHIDMNERVLPMIPPGGSVENIIID